MPTYGRVFGEEIGEEEEEARGKAEGADAEAEEAQGVAEEAGSLRCHAPRIRGEEGGGRPGWRNLAQGQGEKKGRTGTGGFGGRCGPRGPGGGAVCPASESEPVAHAAPDDVGLVAPEGLRAQEHVQR